MERLYQKKIQFAIASALLLLGGIGGYLGSLYFHEMPRIIVEASPAIEGNIQTPLYVASIHGRVYHLVSCRGADRIQEKNKRYFSSRTQAEATGLRPSKTCKEILLFP